MVRGPPVVLDICLCGPSKKVRKIKRIAYHTIAENLRVWKWHTAIVFHFFSQYWHFMKFPTLPIYRLPTLLSTKNEEFKALWTKCFSPSFPCTSCAAPVTQPVNTRIYNRGQNTKPFHVFMTNLIGLPIPNLYTEKVTYCKSSIECAKLHIIIGYWH